MEDFAAGRSFDASGAEQRSIAFDDPSALFNADDPLGDEAAFPTTWQHLASVDGPRD